MKQPATIKQKNKEKKPKLFYSQFSTAAVIVKAVETEAEAVSIYNMI